MRIHGISVFYMVVQWRYYGLENILLAFGREKRVRGQRLGERRRLWLRRWDAGRGRPVHGRQWAAGRIIESAMLHALSSRRAVGKKSIKATSDGLQ